MSPRCFRHVFQADSLGIDLKEPDSIPGSEQLNGHEKAPALEEGKNFDHLLDVRLGTAEVTHDMAKNSLQTRASAASGRPAPRVVALDAGLNLGGNAKGDRIAVSTRCVPLGRLDLPFPFRLLRVFRTRRMAWVVPEHFAR